MRITGLITFLIMTCALSAQEKLTLENAVKTGLENNFSIKVARSEYIISQNNVTLGNAGILPGVDLTSSINASVSDYRTETQQGVVNERNGASSDNRNAGVELNWTIFDGMNMFISYARLKEFRQAGEIRMRGTIEDNLASIITAYYNIVSIQQNIDAIRYAVTVSEERLKFTEDKYQLGSASKLELMQARVDLNADRAQLLREQIALSNAKASMNQLMGRQPETDFIITDSIIVRAGFDYQQMKDRTLGRNYQLRLADKNVSVAELNLSGFKSLWYPTIGVSAGYNYSESSSDFSTLRLNRSNGFSYGLNLRFNIFEGFNTRRQIENARVDLDISRLEYENEKNRVLSEFERQWSNYENGLDLLKMETENLAVARQSIEVAYEKLKYGGYSPLEFREAQRSYLNAQSRLVSAQFNAKEAEIELSRLSGSLSVDGQ